MKLLLLTPRYHCGGMESIQGPLMNLGPLFVAGAALRAGHKAELLDLTAEDLSTEQCLAYIEKSKPAVVGITVRTYLTDEALRLSKAIKKQFPNIYILLGGIHVTFTWSEIMAQNAHVDFILCGEGEMAIGALLDALDNGDDLGTVSGLVWRKDSVVITNPRCGLVQNLDECRPAYHLIKNWDLYRNHFNSERSAVVQFSRGCVQKCRFCSVWQFWEEWRSCSPVLFADELAMLYTKYGVRYFLLADESPEVDRELWLEVLKEVEARKLTDAVICSGGRVRDIIRDVDIIDRYARAGFLVHLMGAEFVTKQSLESAKKEQSLAEVKQAIDLLRANGMIAIIDIMLGWEDGEPELDKIFSGVRFLSPDFICFFWTTPFPWTLAYAELKDRLSLNREYGKWNFMVSFNKQINQTKIDAAAMRFYFAFHFSPLRLIGNCFSVTWKRKRVYWAIIKQGLCKALFEVLPVLHLLCRNRGHSPVMLRRCITGEWFVAGDR